MTPQELESCVLAGLLNGGASPDAFDVIASTPEESFSIVFHRRAFSEIKKQALTNGLIDMLFISEALGGSSLADLSEISRMPATVPNLKGYAGKMVKAWRSRRMAELLQHGADGIRKANNQEQRDQIVETAVAQLLDMTGDTGDVQPVHMSELLPVYMETMQKRMDGEEGILSGAFPVKRLAKLGINDNMAARIKAEFQKHGEVIEGWHIGNFDKWDDQYAAGLLQSAVLKDVNNTVITPGIGDTPLWASTPLGKTVFQFKSFATASYNRATLGGLQEGTAQFYYGTAFQIGLGSLTYALKQAANGREVDLTPQKMVLEGIDRSGILGPLMEYNNMAEKASGGMIGLGPLLGTGTQSRYASRGFIGSALGPTFGLLDTVTDVTAGVLNGDAGDRVLHSVRTLLPGNNLFWIAPLINQVDPSMR